jgi:hypothetical protein
MVSWRCQQPERDGAFAKLLKLKRGPGLNRNVEELALGRRSRAALAVSPIVLTEIKASRGLMAKTFGPVNPIRHSPFVPGSLPAGTPLRIPRLSEAQNAWGRVILPTIGLRTLRPSRRFCRVQPRTESAEGSLGPT